MTDIKDWTPRQAGYDLTAVLAGSTQQDGTGLLVEFVRTRHGAVARVWLGRDLTEVLMWRHPNRRPTFQGTVRLTSDGWTGIDPDGKTVTGVHADYLHAEAPLLRLRTARRSCTTFPWPSRITRR